jgi:hypothetical protein
MTTLDQFRAFTAGREGASSHTRGRVCSPKKMRQHFHAARRGSQSAYKALPNGDCGLAIENVPLLSPSAIAHSQSRPDRPNVHAVSLPPSRHTKPGKRVDYRPKAAANPTASYPPSPLRPSSLNCEVGKPGA